MPLMIDIKQTNKQKVIIFLFVEKQILHFTIILLIFLTLPSSNSVKHEFLGNSKYYLRLIRSTWGPKWVCSMSCARHLKWLVFYQYFLVRSPVTLRARSTILASVSPFACGSRVISRDSPQRENLLAGHLRTFIRQSLLKLRIVKERAPENEPRIQLGVNWDLTIYYRRVFTNLSAYWACKRTLFSLSPPPSYFHLLFFRLLRQK